MRTLLAIGTLAALGFVTPASAQMMCGPAQQAQAQQQGQPSGQYTPAQSGGMMCGMGAAAQEDPMADKPANPPQQQGMMCPCCRNMAMMRGRQSGQGSMPGMQH